MNIEPNTRHRWGDTCTNQSIEVTVDWRHLVFGKELRIFRALCKTMPPNDEVFPEDHPQKDFADQQHACVVGKPHEFDRQVAHERTTPPDSNAGGWIHGRKRTETCPKDFPPNQTQKQTNMELTQQIPYIGGRCPWQLVTDSLSVSYVEKTVFTS